MSKLRLPIPIHYIQGVHFIYLALAHQCKCYLNIFLEATPLNNKKKYFCAEDGSKVFNNPIQKKGSGGVLTCVFIIYTFIRMYPRFVPALLCAKEKYTRFGIFKRKTKYFIHQRSSSYKYMYIVYCIYRFYIPVYIHTLYL